VFVWAIKQLLLAWGIVQTLKMSAKSDNIKAVQTNLRKNLKIP